MNPQPHSADDTQREFCAAGRSDYAVGEHINGKRYCHHLECLPIEVQNEMKRLEDDKLVARLVKKHELQARLDELGGVQLEYGNRLAQTFINGEALLVGERYEQLKKELENL